MLFFILVSFAEYSLNKNKTKKKVENGDVRFVYTKSNSLTMNQSKCVWVSMADVGSWNWHELFLNVVVLISTRTVSK